MSFLNPYFLAGLAAAALPVLIHLLTRDRVRREAFSTLRFFQKASRRVLRRKRLREMILLAMRVAACALVAVAFARPLLEAVRAAAPGLVEAKRARVILLDTSASMARAGAAEAARREVEGALAGLAPGADAAALITFDDAPRLDVPLAGGIDAVRAAARAAAPGRGGTDLVEALRKADAVLRGASAPSREIVLISDLQRAGWRGFRGDWRLGPGVRLVVRPVAPSRADDLAIIEADVPGSVALDGLARTVAVRVANFSDREQGEVEVRFAIGDKPVDSRKVRIRAGESVPVRFRHVFASPGDNPGTVTVVGDDAMPEDNVFCFNARVIPRIRVTLLAGGPAASGAAVASSPASDPAFFLETALAPAPESPFVVRRVEAARAAPADVQGAQVVILADVREVPAEVAAALEAHLARGGGVWFLPGGSVDADVFGRVFARVAPCKLRNVYRPPSRPGETPGLALAKVDFEHPVFEVFQHPHYGDLAAPRFRQFWEVGDSQLCRVPARFEDGKPAVLEREVGAGLTMMLTSPTDLKWNTFPLRAVFLPYLHQTVRYLAVRSEKPTLFRVGDVLPVPEGWTLTDPAGRARPAGDAVAAAPGPYVARDAAGTETLRFAVNLDPAEADPAAIRPEELTAAVSVPEDAAAAQGLRDVTDGRDRPKDDRGLWWYVVAAVVLLSVAELFVANRTQRH